MHCHTPHVFRHAIKTLLPLFLPSTNARRKVEGVALADVPHMIVWGGVGTRMDANIPELVEKWARAVLSRAAPEDAE